MWHSSNEGRSRCPRTNSRECYSRVVHSTFARGFWRKTNETNNCESNCMRRFYFEITINGSFVYKCTNNVYCERLNVSLLRIFFVVKISGLEQDFILWSSDTLLDTHIISWVVWLATWAINFRLYDTLFNFIFISMLRSGWWCPGVKDSIKRFIKKCWHLFQFFQFFPSCMTKKVKPVFERRSS